MKPTNASQVAEEAVSERRVSQKSRDSASSVRTGPAEMAGQTPVYEDASRFCPVCSERLESRRCKLVCNVCGYYMSCADYY